MSFITGQTNNQTEEVDHPSQSPGPSLFTRKSVKIVKRLAKASRECAGRKLATILDSVVDKNDPLWYALPQMPLQRGCHRSLATAVNRQLKEEEDPPPSTRPSSRRGNCHPTDYLATILASRVLAKLEDGDFRGVDWPPLMTL